MGYLHQKGNVFLFYDLSQQLNTRFNFFNTAILINLSAKRIIANFSIIIIHFADCFELFRIMHQTTNMLDFPLLDLVNI
jgi:hypothetical protein